VSDVQGVYSKVMDKLESFLGRDAKGEARPALELAREVLGPRFTNVIDVGARSAGMEGKWWRLDGVAAYFGFEPDVEECGRLNASAQGLDGIEKYFPVALGAAEEEATLFITQNPACSSLYAPDEAVITRYPELQVAKRTSEMKVSVVPLDKWWDDNARPDVSFVKLDTQGSELDILRGGVRLLKGCVGCEVEVEFSPIYRQQPLFHEVDRFMREAGFTLWRLYGLCHYTEEAGGAWTRTETVSYGGENRTFAAGSGRLFWANAIYFRDHVDAFYAENSKKLLVLLALLEGCKDDDGVKSVSKKIIQRKLISDDALR
jgi:FkbM family methyltransferase